MNKIYFYVPNKKFIVDWPVDFWPSLLSFLKSHKHIRFDGPYGHTLHPYVYFRSLGLPCELVSSWPIDEGIIMAHSDFLSASRTPQENQTIVEIKPDRAIRCPFANFYIIQNRHDPITRWRSRSFLKSIFVNNWPQPGLLPRDPGRGNLFENICFIGNQRQMYPGLQSLGSALLNLGLKWKIITDRSAWHDYREVDAIVALRRQLDYDYPAKPGNKLYNAWLAGVPAILGPERAYRTIGKRNIDYLEAKTVEESIEQIKFLQTNLMARNTLVQFGAARAAKFRCEQTAERWRDFTIKTIIPHHRRWINSPMLRHQFFAVRGFYVRFLHKRYYHDIKWV